MKEQFLTNILTHQMYQLKHIAKTDKMMFKTAYLEVAIISLRAIKHTRKQLSLRGSITKDAVMVRPCILVGN